MRTHEKSFFFLTFSVSYAEYKFDCCCVVNQFLKVPKVNSSQLYNILQVTGKLSLSASLHWILTSFKEKYNKNFALTKI